MTDITSPSPRIEPMLPAVPSVPDELRRLSEALEWYRAQTEGCRKLGSIGDPFRQALDRDGGKRAEEALAAARSCLAAPPAARVVGEPDYVYNPANWEATYDWADRSLLHDDLCPDVGEVKRASTLISGPDKWVAHVVLTRDEDGDPDETEVRWFDSEADALAAIAPAPPSITTTPIGRVDDGRF